MRTIILGKTGLKVNKTVLVPCQFNGLAKRKL